MNRKLRVIFTTCIFLAVAPQLHAVDLGGKLPGLNKDSSGPASAAEDPLEAQSALVSRYLSSAEQISAAQIKFGEALGLKEEAAALAADTRALQSGTVSAGALEKHQATSTGMEAKIDEKIRAGEELSAEGRKTFAEGLVPFSIGLSEGVKLKPEFERFADTVSSYAKTAPPLEKATVMNKVKPGLYVSRKAPGYLANLTTTSTTIIEFAKSNEIEIPKEATDALGDL